MGPGSARFAFGGQPDAMLATSKRREQRSVFLFRKLRQFPCSSFPRKGEWPLRGKEEHGKTWDLLPDIHRRENPFAEPLVASDASDAFLIPLTFASLASPSSNMIR